MLGFIYTYGIVLQAIAVVHFVRRRPETFWLWIILIGGGLGALAYIALEVVPDLGLLRGAFQAFPRRKRITELQTAILDNPSTGNYEELGHLYLDDEQFARARECFDRALARRDASPDSVYRRALCEIALEDFPAAVSDLERVVQNDARYDYHRAAGLLAHALARTGDYDKAAARFANVTRVSTLSETQVNYASCLAEHGRLTEAREWAERVLAKKATMPAYLRRRERPWFRRAAALLKRLRRPPT
jgi:hypothetical protein